MKLWADTKSNIEALSVPEGFTAYATDTNELGSYDGAAWDWVVWQGARTLTIAEIDDGDSPYTAGDDDVITVDASGGVVTVELPAIAGITGRRYQIKCIDSTNVVTIDGDGAETIDGSATVTLVQYDSLVVVAGSSEWHIM